MASNFSIDNLADSFDWTSVHFTLCFVGAILCLYVMKLFSTGALHVDGECFISHVLRRSSLVTLALSMCWAMTYSTNKGWQPWPPDVFVVAAVDLFMLAPVVVAFRRKRSQRALG